MLLLFHNESFFYLQGAQVMHGMNFRYKLFVMSLGLAHGLAFATQADVALGKEDQIKEQVVGNDVEEQGVSVVEPAVEVSTPSKSVVATSVVEQIIEQPKKAADIFAYRPHQFLLCFP